MTYKKPILEKVSKTQPSEWIPVIQSVFREFGTVVIVILSAWSIYIGQQNKETMTQVKRQSDGFVTASKLSIAISARALATATKNPGDEKTADEAEAAYRASVENLNNSKP